MALTEITIPQKAEKHEGFWEEIKKEVSPIVAFIIIVILLFVLVAILNFINYLMENPWVAYVFAGILAFVGFLYLREKLGIAWPSRKKLPLDSFFLERLPPEVQSILKEATDCYQHHLYGPCSVMMRKCLDTAVTLRFKRDGRGSELLLPSSELLSLPKKIELAKQRRYITSSISSKLRQLKWMGDIGAHDYKAKVRKEDIKEDFRTLRIALEHMYH